MIDTIKRHLIEALDFFTFTGCAFFWICSKMCVLNISEDVRFGNGGLEDEGFGDNGLRGIGFSTEEGREEASFFLRITL